MTSCKRIHTLWSSHWFSNNCFLCVKKYLNFQGIFSQREQILPQFFPWSRTFIWTEWIHSVCFLPIFFQRETTSLFAFLYTKTLPKRSLLHKEKNLPLWRADSYWQSRQNIFDWVVSLGSTCISIHLKRRIIENSFTSHLSRLLV